MSEWGFADIYSMEADQQASAGDLEDVRGDDWRNILVLGRATADGVYPETLALVGRARHLADELGCRVEVLLIGENLEGATKVLSNYPIHTVYRVQAADYAPIDHTARILEAIVRKRRPELIMAFQSRSGDAVIAYAANRLGVGFVSGVTALQVDTQERRVQATHVATNRSFHIVTAFDELPQFVSVQRGLFRAPMEDPYASVKVHDMEVDPGPRADIRVIDQQPPPAPTLAEAERVVIAGARIRSEEELELARELARRTDSVFGVTRSLVDRGLAADAEMVGEHDTRIRPRLLLTVGVRGSLEFLQAIQGHPTICAVASERDDPVALRAAYVVPGKVAEAVQALLDAL